MELTYDEVKKRIENNEEVACWGTTVNFVCSTFNGSPHISNYLKPTFGMVKDEGYSILTFHKEKANGDGFIKNGRLFDGLTCFTEYSEAILFYNELLHNFIKIKQNEIVDAEELLVQD